MRYFADLHVHSHFSRATSDHCRPRPLAAAAARKGLTVLGTGDFTHAGWRSELGAELIEAEEDGIYRLREHDGADAQASADGSRADGCEEAASAPDMAAGVRFVVTGEISCIYKQGGRTRKIHHVVLLPNLDAAARVSAALEARGANLEADGRPIIGLDSHTLLALILDVEPRALLIPAHIWTPHFSLFGANSGFDALEECFGDLATQIVAYETGLSSDPPMNWRLSALDRLTLVSNSDAHSPDKLGREAIEFDAPLSYQGMVDALRGSEGARVGGTIEFYPEEGKYHYDGHRACGVCWHPRETQAAGGLCPVCGRPVTIGVLHRVADLADRPEGFRPPGANPYWSLVSLGEIVAEALGVGPASRRARELEDKLVHELGAEIPFLREAPLEDIAALAGPVVAEAVRRVRHGEVSYRPGYDGEYGKLTIFSAEERRELSGQALLFALPGTYSGGTRRGAGSATRVPRAPRAPLGEATDRSVEASAELALQSASATEMRPTPETAPETVPGTAPGIAPGTAPGTAPGITPGTASAAASTTASGTARSPLDGLNEAQRQAVVARRGPVIVAAGPGTGKTRTLVHRVAFLIGEGVPPESITAITFTHRAADEMRARLNALLGDVGSRVTVGTFHRFCADLIAETLGTPPLVLDEREAGLLAAEAAASVAAARGAERIPAPAEAFSRLKGCGLRPDDPEVPPALAEPYRRYQELLAAAEAYDYDDLLLGALDIVRRDDNLAGLAPRERATHLLVDEFQDVNAVQYELVRALAGDGSNLFVIGDPDQAIYGFRGADRRFFAQLAADFPQATHVRLSLNYRSSATIVRAANALLTQVSQADVSAARPGGGLIRYVPIDSPHAEPRTVVREIERLVGGTGMLAADRQSGEMPARPFSLGEIAILFRTGRQADPIEEALLAEGIPYRAFGQRAITSAPAVREALDILRYVDRQTDLRFMIALRDTRFNPGAEVLAMLAASARAARPASGSATPGSPRSPLAATAAALAAAGSLKPTARARLQAFLDLLAELTALAPTAPASDLLVRAAGPEAAATSRAVRQVALAARDVSLSEFLFRLATGQDADHERREDLARPGAHHGVHHGAYHSEGVSLLTMHAAKGLEFPAVILIGLADGVVPWKDSVDGEALAEERRLFYVALTRAAEALVLVGPAQPDGRSRFVRELPAEVLEVVGTAGDRDDAGTRKPPLHQHRLF